MSRVLLKCSCTSVLQKARITIKFHNLPIFHFPIAAVCHIDRDLKHSGQIAGYLLLAHTSHCQPNGTRCGTFHWAGTDSPKHFEDSNNFPLRTPTHRTPFHIYSHFLSSKSAFNRQDIKDVLAPVGMSSPCLLRCFGCQGTRHRWTVAASTSTKPTLKFMK